MPDAPLWSVLFLANWDQPTAAAGTRTPYKLLLFRREALLHSLDQTAALLLKLSRSATLQASHLSVHRQQLTCTAHPLLSRDPPDWPHQYDAVESLVGLLRAAAQPRLGEGELEHNHSEPGLHPGRVDPLLSAALARCGALQGMMRRTASAQHLLHGSPMQVVGSYWPQKLCQATLQQSEACRTDMEPAACPSYVLARVCFMPRLTSSLSQRPQFAVSPVCRPDGAALRPRLLREVLRDAGHRWDPAAAAGPADAAHQTGADT